MSVNAVDPATGNTTPLAGNTNNLVGNLSALTTSTKSDAVGAINELNQTKQNTESGKGLSTNDFSNTYKDKVDNNAGAIEAIVNEYGAKNLLPNRATSQTLNGVTFTVNTDGSVTVNGTATARIDFNIARQDVDGFHLGSGNYIINGCPADGGSESYHLLMSVNNTWGTKDVGQGVTVNGTIEAVVIRVMSGVTVNNKTFYPMVRDARISDDTYVPYAMTNRELTGAVDQLRSGLNNLVKSETMTVTTDSSGGALFDLPSGGTILVSIRPLRDADYYNLWWGVTIGSRAYNSGYGFKAIKDDGTTLASQNIKFDVYYI